MVIQDLLGYTLTCKMSKNLKNEPEYNECEFSIVVYEDEHSDSSYSATVSGVVPDGESFNDTWDGETVAENIIFGTWTILHKTKNQ